MTSEDAVDLPEEKSVEQILEEHQEWAANILLDMDPKITIARDLWVLASVHLTPERGSDIPRNQLDTALMIAVARLERRIIALEAEIDELKKK